MKKRKSKPRKYKYDIVYASIHVAPNVWTHHVHSTFVGTQREVIEHVKTLNESIHPGARSKKRYTYKRNKVKQNAV